MLKPRSAIVGLGPYRSPIVSREGLSLDLNESLAGCSPKVLARLRALSAADVSFYPERERGERLVGDFLGVSPDRVLLTNGMDEALFLLFNAYLEASGPDRSQVLFADPTFVMYPTLGQAMGADVVRVESGKDLAFPADELLKRITSRTRLIAIANPNNPTGLAASRHDLLQVVGAAPDAAVLIDEAYYEFCGETLLGEIKDHPNLFVARTFSKAYGLAGLRLGVLVGPPEQIELLRRLSIPFNVNAVALACLEEALGDQEFVRGHVAEVKAGRRELQKLFEELGLHFWPSQTSFVLVRVGTAAADFVELMRRREILVRDSSGQPGCDGCVRVTVGNASQMGRVHAAIRETIAEIRG